MDNIDLNIKWEDRTEQIWVLHSRGGMHSAYVSENAAEDVAAKQEYPWRVEEVELHRPSLQPIYGGPTLLEALWNEMDRLMEALMTGEVAEDVCNTPGCNAAQSPCGHTDNGDKYRAQQLAWVLAVVSNPYDPSVDRIRAEAMDRWNALQSEEVDPSAGHLGGVAS